jgi:eukaryotic-like serine/threonine-protein kinase
MTGAANPRDRDLDSLESDFEGRLAERVVAGSILGGKYRLISEIGRGGMGSVWRAEHLQWEAPVALKIMNRDITARPEAVARFEREVRLAAGLRSPHVVQVLDHGVDPVTRTPYIAMELLEGESLARRLKRLGSLSAGETFHVFSQLVRALTRAHAAGIVHRDLKPDNVFLVKNDEESLTKVLDFGVAKWTAPDISESGLTRPGSVVGTPYYMSPEQIQGSRDIDHRADLWALAAIACECLTGRRPFEARDFAQLAVMLLGNQGRPLPSSLGPVPPHFDAWFLRATDPDITRRFQTAREMVQTLAPICDVAPSSPGSDPFGPAHALTSTRHDAPSMAPTSNTSSRLLMSSGLMHPSLWQRPMAKLVASTVLVTLLVTGGFALWLVRRSPRGALPAPTSATEVPSPVTATNKPGSSFGIRPIRGDEPVLAPPVTPQPSTPDSAADRRGVSPNSAGSRLAGSALERSDSRAANDDFDPEANLETKQRSVRAALLARPKLQKAKSKRPKPSDVRPAKATEATESATPPPRAAKPAAPPSEDAPSLVDGRRIRTSL